MEGKKYDAGKARFGLIPPFAEEEVAKVLTHGSLKYDDDNWKLVDNGEKRYKDALGRHLNAYRKGIDLDTETGLHHLAHLICNAMFLLDSYCSGVPLAPPKKKEKPKAEIINIPMTDTIKLSEIDKNYTLILEHWLQSNDCCIYVDGPLEVCKGFVNGHETLTETMQHATRFDIRALLWFLTATKNDKNDISLFRIKK